MIHVDVKNIGAWIFFHLFLFVWAAIEHRSTDWRKRSTTVSLSLASMLLSALPLKAHLWRKRKNPISFSFVWPWYVSRVQSHTPLIYVSGCFLARCLSASALFCSFNSFYVSACLHMHACLCIYTPVALPAPKLECTGILVVSFWFP